MNLLAILESLESWMLLFEWVVEKRLCNVSELPPSMQLLVCRHLGVDLCSTICLFEGKNIVLCNCLYAGIWGLTCALLSVCLKGKISFYARWIWSRNPNVYKFCLQPALSMIDFGGLDFDRVWVTQAKQTSENELKKNYSLCSKHWPF